MEGIFVSTSSGLSSRGTYIREFNISKYRVHTRNSMLSKCSNREYSFRGMIEKVKNVKFDFIRIKKLLVSR